MPNIHFIQYLRPDGRRSPVTINRPETIVKKADFILSHGFRFECEVLTTNQVSFTIFDPETDLDAAIRICDNGPDVPSVVDALILAFDVAKALKARKIEKD